MDIDPMTYYGIQHYGMNDMNSNNDLQPNFDSIGDRIFNSGETPADKYAMIEQVIENITRGGIVDNDHTLLPSTQQYDFIDYLKSLQSHIYDEGFVLNRNDFDSKLTQEFTEYKTLYSSDKPNIDAVSDLIFDPTLTSSDEKISAIDKAISIAHSVSIRNNSYQYRTDVLSNHNMLYDTYVAKFINYLNEMKRSINLGDLSANKEEYDAFLNQLFSDNNESLSYIDSQVIKIRQEQMKEMMKYLYTNVNYDYNDGYTKNSSTNSSDISNNDNFQKLSKSDQNPTNNDDLQINDSSISTDLSSDSNQESRIKDIENLTDILIQ